MTKDRNSLLQELLNRVLKEGKKEKDREHESDRQSEGSYIRGFSNYTTVAVLETNGFTVRATQIDWKAFSPSADAEGVRHALKILKGEDAVFEATREGASTSKNFGYEESYTGTTDTPEGEWKITRGELPKELETVSA
jgi:hypothetical protein